MRALPPGRPRWLEKAQSSRRWRCGLEKCATSGGQRLPRAGDPVWSTAVAGPRTGFGLAAAVVGGRVYELRENQAAPGVSNPHDVSPSSARRNASTCALLADRRRGGIRRAITDVLDSGKAATIARPPPLDMNLANWLPEAQRRNWRISYRPQGEGLLHSRAVETFIESVMHAIACRESALTVVSTCPTTDRRTSSCCRGCCGAGRSS